MALKYVVDMKARHFYNHQDPPFDMKHQLMSADQLRVVNFDLKINCPGCFTVSRYTFWDPIFFDEKSIIQAILRYMGHQKWTKSQI